MHDAGGVLCQRHASTGRIQALRIGVSYLHSFHVSYTKASYLKIITDIKFTPSYISRILQICRYNRAPTVSRVYRRWCDLSRIVGQEEESSAVS